MLYQSTIVHCTSYLLRLLILLVLNVDFTSFPLVSLLLIMAIRRLIIGIWRSGSWRHLYGFFIELEWFSFSRGVFIFFFLLDFNCFFVLALRFLSHRSGWFKLSWLFFYKGLLLGERFFVFLHNLLNSFVELQVFGVPKKVDSYAL